MSQLCKSTFDDVRRERVFDGFRDELASMNEDTTIRVCTAAEAKKVLAQPDTILFNALPEAYADCTARQGTREIPTDDRRFENCAVHCAVLVLW